MKKQSVLDRGVLFVGVLTVAVCALVLATRPARPVSSPHLLQPISQASASLPAAASGVGLPTVRIQKLGLVERLNGASSQAASSGNSALAETLADQAKLLRDRFVPAVIRRGGPDPDRDWHVVDSDPCPEQPCLYFTLAEKNSGDLAAWYPGLATRVLVASSSDAFANSVALSLLARELAHAQWTLVHNDWGFVPPALTKDSALPDQDAAYALQTSVLDLRTGGAYTAAVQDVAAKILSGKVQTMSSAAYGVLYLPTDVVPPVPEESLSAAQRLAAQSAWREAFLVSVNLACETDDARRKTLVARLALGVSSPGAHLRIP